MRRLLTLGLLLPLLGCMPAISPRHVAFLNSLIGRSEADLVRAVGVPTRTYEAGGHKFLAYDRGSRAIYPDPVAPYPWGWGWGYGYGVFPEVVDYHCETTFEIAEGRVLTWARRGNACY